MAWDHKSFKDERVKLRLSQEDMARRLNCSATSIRNYEAGRVAPSFDLLVELCELTGQNINYFRRVKA